MSADASWFAILMTILGGMALFLLGMELMTDALQRLAGFQVRSMLSRLTRNRVAGLAGGTAAGTLIHSGPATVIILGFVNAGILSLHQTIGLVFGANIGTTLSMQVLAFDIGKYSLLVLAVAMVLRLVFRSWKAQTATMVLIGFGLLFLGLEVMKGAAEGMRSSDTLSHAIAFLTADTFGGILIGIAVGTLLTMVFQSSGATVSLLFSLAAVGVIGRFEQTIPLILGAHIGTCTPTLLAAARGTRDALRVSMVHLLFNIVGAVVALAMWRIYTTVVPLTSDSVVRQIANFNTGVQVVNALLFLPFAIMISRLMYIMIPRKKEEGGTSHLDRRLVQTPEMAIMATIKELERVGEIVTRMLKNSLDGLVSLDVRKFERVQSQEDRVDIIKRQIEAYINEIGERSLSPRQGTLLQQLIVSSHALERIADYIEALGKVSKIKIEKRIWFDDASMAELLTLSSQVGDMLRLTIAAIDPTDPGHRETASNVLQLRKEYKSASKKLRKRANERLLADGKEAGTGLFFVRYLAVFDNIVDHLREIARQERKDTYLVKEYKLNRVEPIATPLHTMPDNYELPSTYEEALAHLREKQWEDDDNGEEDVPEAVGEKSGGEYLSAKTEERNSP